MKLSSVNRLIIICVIIMSGFKSTDQPYDINTKPHNFFQNALFWGDSINSVIAKNGQPNNTIEAPFESEQYNRTDKIITLSYNNVSLKFHQFKINSELDRKELLLSVTLNNCGSALLFEEITCSGTENLIEQLGTPNYQTEDEISYMIVFGDMGASPTTFTIDAGKVISIKWNFFID